MGLMDAMCRQTGLAHTQPVKSQLSGAIGIGSIAPNTNAQPILKFLPGATGLNRAS